MIRALPNWGLLFRAHDTLDNFATSARERYFVSIQVMECFIELLSFDKQRWNATQISLGERIRSVRDLLKHRCATIQYSRSNICRWNGQWKPTHGIIHCILTGLPFSLESTGNVFVPVFCICIFRKLNCIPRKRVLRGESNLHMRVTRITFLIIP